MIKLSCDGCNEVAETIEKAIRALQYWGVKNANELDEQHFCPTCSRTYLPGRLEGVKHD